MYLRPRQRALIMARRFRQVWPNVRQQTNLGARLRRVTALAGVGSVEMSAPAAVPPPIATAVDEDPTTFRYAQSQAAVCVLVRQNRTQT